MQGKTFLHRETLPTLDSPFKISLRDLQLRNNFNESHAQFLCLSLLTSLKHAHTLGMVHGNIKPGNVIFTQSGYPCLTGFEGYQTAEIQSRPIPTRRIEYTSPEEMNSEPITSATDVFQTGILVYSLIYGRSPFKSDNYNKTRANMLEDSFIVEFESGTMSKDGRYFIRKLLKTNPTSRFNLDKCKKPLNKAAK